MQVDTSTSLPPTRNVDPSFNSCNVFLLYDNDLPKSLPSISLRKHEDPVTFRTP